MIEAALGGVVMSSGATPELFLQLYNALRTLPDAKNLGLAA